MQEELDRINALHLWDFEVAHHDCGDLLIIAGNDITPPARPRSPIPRRRVL
jgi:hypothetical protein